MNLPNRLTVARVLIVPVFLVVMLAPCGIAYRSLWALILFAAASYTDRLDGRIARRTNQVTNFGKFMDPLADKILVMSALICFVQFGLAEAWMVILILAREFLVTGIRLIAAERGRVIAANRWGKAKTVSQICAIIAVLAFRFVLELVEAGRVPRFAVLGADCASAFGRAGNILILIATVFSVVSGAVYLIRNRSLVDAMK